MKELPASVRPVLGRLARRLAIGLFLEVWPTWAAASLLLAGVTALVCRMFFPSAASALPWLWLAPLVAAVPALIVCFMRAYRPSEIVAVADWLGGGQGVLHDAAGKQRPGMGRVAPARTRVGLVASTAASLAASAALVPAAAFLTLALLLPQRALPFGANAVLADEIAADLTATVMELKQQELITPAEEKSLEEEIERIRRGAQERVDASSWEAADAFASGLPPGSPRNRTRVKWAQESLARYAAAAQGGAAVR